MTLEEIATEPDPELRIKLLNNWARPWMHAECEWDDDHGWWTTRWVWNDNVDLDPEEHHRYNTACQASVLQILLGVREPIDNWAIFEETDCWDDIF